jgi:hypothetical protein
VDGVIGQLVATFLAGAANEGVAVFWVHFSERGRPFATGFCAMIQAAAVVVGVGESVHDWRLAPAFVLGYGVGAASGVLAKRGRR